MGREEEARPGKKMLSGYFFRHPPGILREFWGIPSFNIFDLAVRSSKHITSGSNRSSVAPIDWDLVGMQSKMIRFRTLCGECRRIPQEFHSDMRGGKKVFREIFSSWEMLIRKNFWKEFGEKKKRGQERKCWAVSFSPPLEFWGNFEEFPLSIFLNSQWALRKRQA